MADTGAVSPGTITEITDGTGAWTTPDNAKVSDSSNATRQLTNDAP
jgi:hypothetical protein